MKIYDKVIQSVPEVKKSLEKAVRKEATVHDSKDVVSISFKAEEMRKAVEVAKASPDIRSEKVKVLKEEVERGTYSVRSDKVAEKVIGSVLEKVV